MNTRFLFVVGLVSLVACNRTPPENERKPAPAAQQTPAPSPRPSTPSPQTPAAPPPAPATAAQSPFGALGGAAAGGRASAPPSSPTAAATPPAAAAPVATPPAATPPAPPPPTVQAGPARATTPGSIPPPLARATSAGRPHTDNLAALEMGGRVEWAGSRDVGEYARIKLLDSNPATIWMTGNNFPLDVVVSFLNHDEALVSGVTVTLPPRGPIPIWDKPNDLAFAKDVEIWTSMDSAKSGFRMAGSATIPQQSGDHDITFSAPVEARYVKLVIKSNYGSPITGIVSDFAVREGQAPGYVPFLKRHPGLASLLSTGVLTTAAGASAAPPTATDTASKDLCEKPGRAAVHSTVPESRNVYVVATEAEGAYGPFDYQINAPKSPPVRYFPSDPGDGRVDSSIFERANFWTVQPSAAVPAALLQESGVDTVVLAQICDIKTSVSDAFKRALGAWVAAGHKLIIQDADGCGPGREPDYSFLPFPFATSNPGAQGAASVMRLVENSALASDDRTDPAFLDLDSWAQKKNGNTNNDFGDSNTVVKYDPHWCGAMVGTNVKGANGFVVVYGHYGSGLIIYDGLDRDQYPNVAYRQWVARQLLVPFAPDPLPCSTHLSPFVVTTASPLVTRDVLPGQTYTYPISVLPVQPGYSGSVRLSLDTPPALGDLHARIDPETVTLGGETKATLSVTMPAKLPEPWNMAVRGTAAGGNATLCLAARERKTGTLHVVADLGPQPAAPESRKNLLIILDLSGSMNLPLGKSTRIGTARQVLRDVLNKLPDDFKVGLRLYGHRYGSRQKETCTDSELRIPVQPLDRNAILRTIDSTRPRGETPLVYSVLQAIGDLKGVGGGSVVLITDGEESCGGDFAAAANAIKASGLDFRLNIVGFTLASQLARQQLGTLTASTGGAYYVAADGPALTHALVAATITRFPYTVYDASGAEVAHGEAGDRGQELTAGTYRVVVQAGEDRLTIEQVTVDVAGSVGLRVTRKGTGFAIER